MNPDQLRLEALRLTIELAVKTGYQTTEQTIERANAFAIFLDSGVPVDNTTISDEPL